MPLLLVPEDVTRPHVPVDDPLAVGRFKRRCHLAEDLPRLRYGKSPLGLQALLHRASLDEAHDKVGSLVGQTPEAAHGHNVRMVGQRSGRAGLALEAFPGGLIVGPAWVEDLDRNQDPERAVLREEHARHSPVAEPLQDLEILAEGGSEVAYRERLGLGFCFGAAGAGRGCYLEPPNAMVAKTPKVVSPSSVATGILTAGPIPSTPLKMNVNPRINDPSVSDADSSPKGPASTFTRWNRTRP